jgi:hypothetical protein
MVIDVDLPIINMVIFHSYVAVDQRVVKISMYQASHEGCLWWGDEVFSQAPNWYRKIPPTPSVVVQDPFPQETGLLPTSKKLGTWKKRCKLPSLRVPSSVPFFPTPLWLSFICNSFNLQGSLYHSAGQLNPNLRCGAQPTDVCWRIIFRTSKDHLLDISTYSYNKPNNYPPVTSITTYG